MMDKACSPLKKEKEQERSARRRMRIHFASSDERKPLVVSHKRNVRETVRIISAVDARKFARSYP